MPYKRTGGAARPLLESEIKAAQIISKSAMDAARNLDVSYNTYKRWAKKYGLHESFKNIAGKKISKTQRDPKKGKYPVDDILAGMYPDYPTFRFKKKLFNTGYKKEECEICGYNEKRINDGKAPLILDYVDGNVKNKALDNLKVLCLNCCHNTRGYVSRGKKNFHDTDIAQREPYYRRPVQKVDISNNEDEMEIDISNLTDEEIQELLG